ncbi:hypothetical protein ACFTQ7_02800 [Lysinibacillus sp. NPDC056959]|uniref:hypothetical protein n=1 Tax=Lysinibacillus sp. NPDC056959 TaxID=3345981 RepID=UPI0036363562
MKRITLLSFLLLLMISPSVQALSWAYPSVVWKGNVYEVKKEELIEDNKIGKIIGEVKTKPNNMTGNYCGNASNYYPKGAHYYEIKGTSTSIAIAVKEDRHWVKAVFVHKAPFHIMNGITNFYFILAVVLFVIGVILFRIKMSKECIH